MGNLLETYNVIKECYYKNEYYSVRDDGAVLRHPLINKRVRPTDNKWTFGKINIRTGYLEIASVRIHSIIATAFHGEPPTKYYVVDHIDTNKHNNRPDNLRWVTRLENVLLNPITVKRIEIACDCSVEEFLSDPSKYRDKLKNSNYNWMSRVSIKEAQLSKKRLLAWAESDTSLRGGTLGKWIFSSDYLNKFDEPIEGKAELIESLTQYAVQNARNWKTPCEFPCCPDELSNNQIIQYFNNLDVEKVFSRNQYAEYIIQDFTISNDKKTLWIMCRSNEENPIKPYSLAEVTYKKNVFIHDSLGTFFEKVGAEKQIMIKQGCGWEGGDSIDDYC